MDERELKTIIDRINEFSTEEKEKLQKMEYMMDFGSVAVLVNVSLN